MKEPYWLLLLFLCVPLVFKKKSASGFSYLPNVSRVPILSRIFLILPFIIFTLLVIALARPHYDIKPKPKKREGIDIVLTVDTSESMLARDFVVGDRRVTRLDVVKSVLANFVDKRKNDNIGLVVFGDVAFTQTPLTYDHGVVKEYLEGLRAGMAGKSTAIGDALAVSAQRLESVQGKTRLIILLTDGRQTAGVLRADDAAAAAAALGYKIYVVGVGAKPSSFFGGFFSQADGLDEGVLKEIAKVGKGQFFRAENTDDLLNIYAKIDELEKSKLDGKDEFESKEGYMFFLWPAFFLFIFEILIGLTRYRVIP